MRCVENARKKKAKNGEKGKAAPRSRKNAERDAA